MTPVFLIGYMGSGKTTLGRAVEARTHISFIDLDEYIEAQQGKTISSIFKEKGEEGFRNLERMALAELSQREDLLVACGGGTPCYFDNMDIMNSRGTTVWLEASVERLHMRLTQAKSSRPLIAAFDDTQLRNFIISSLEKRTPHYSKAKATFCSDFLDNIAEIDSSATEFISKFLK